MSQFGTRQEEFWAGEFGTEYISRNDSKELLASNLNFFSRMLSHAGKISSCIEFGANIGMNLKALKMLYPEIKMRGVEINAIAAGVLSDLIGKENVFEGSVFDFPDSGAKADLVFTKGVLIHINPEKLEIVYRKLYSNSGSFILVCEYYNPSPVTIPYRGHNDRLFKRDFAGEIMEMYPDLKLLDYGFVYRRDNSFPQDDITWFLLKK